LQAPLPEASGGGVFYVRTCGGIGVVNEKKKFGDLLRYAYFCLKDI
jgi:hypothetical protein